MAHHPFYPTSSVILGYTPRFFTQNDILGTFIALVAVVSMACFYWARRLPSLASRLTVLWFVLCGLIHLFVEGYFVVNHATIATQSSFMAELWKEYALSDSRYMTQDPSVVIIEAITMVLWGPLSLLVAYLTIKQSPVRQVVGLVVSVGQLYGDILYYATTLMEGAPHCRPEPFYFYAYFVFANIFWIVIPGALIAHYGRELYKAMMIYQANYSSATPTKRTASKAFVVGQVDVTTPRTLRSAAKKLA